MQRLRTTRLAADWAAAWWLPVQIQPVIETAINTTMKAEIAIRMTFMAVTLTPAIVERATLQRCRTPEFQARPQ